MVRIVIEGPRNDADAALRGMLYSGSTNFSVESIEDPGDQSDLAPEQRRIVVSWARSRG